MSDRWTPGQLQVALDVLRGYPSVQSALGRISKKVGRLVTKDSLRHAFLRGGLENPSLYCAEDDSWVDDWEDKMPKKAPAPVSEVTEAVQRLVAAVKKPVSFEELANKLDLSPSKLRALIGEAKALGMVIHVEGQHVAMRASEDDSTVTEIGVPPVVGERQIIGVISDTHLGSKYCLRAQLKEFIHYAYSLGVREIFHPGDVLDGNYRHGVFEVSHTGLDAQAQDLFETLPQLPGLNYRAITGNHDFTFTESVGVDVGFFLTNYFRERGRNDLHFYGNRSAFLKYGGARIHLWHPKKGCGYAKSYALQKRVEQYASGEKGHLLLVGHWHVHCALVERGVHAIACPTFQGGGSAFSKSLGGAPAIGGLVLSWQLTEHGTMRDFTLNYRSYFEREKTNDVEHEPREEYEVL